MRSMNTLKKYLRQAVLPLSTHRIDLLSELVGALLGVRSVNLMKVAREELVLELEEELQTTHDMQMGLMPKAPPRGSPGNG